jgi:hypothetical protein
MMISSMPKLEEHYHVINRSKKLLEYLRIKKIMSQNNQDNLYCIEGNLKKKIKNQYYKITEADIFCEINEKGLKIYHELWINDLYISNACTL